MSDHDLEEQSLILDETLLSSARRQFPFRILSLVTALALVVGLVGLTLFGRRVPQKTEAPLDVVSVASLAQDFIDDVDWDDLKPDQRETLKSLGYDADTWESGHVEIAY